MTVAASDEHQFSQNTGIKYLTSFPESRVIAVIEADLNADAGAGGRFNDWSKLLDVPGRRLFHNDGPPGLNRSQGDGREIVVCSRHNHGLDIRRSNGLL